MKSDDENDGKKQKFRISIISLAIEDTTMGMSPIDSKNEGESKYVIFSFIEIVFQKHNAVFKKCFFLTLIF